MKILVESAHNAYELSMLLDSEAPEYFTEAVLGLLVK